MSTGLAWVSAGTGGATQTDWDALKADSRFDPYVAWHDYTDFLGKAIANDLVPLILELKRPFDRKEALEHLNRLGLVVTPHYICYSYPHNCKPPTFVTATCVGAEQLGNVVSAVAGEGDEWIKRYELSAGVRNPDTSILERHGQRWEKCSPELAPLPDNVVGFIDYGCAFLHRKLRNSCGVSRIGKLWNQQDEIPSPPPRGRQPLEWKLNSRFACGNDVDAHALSWFSDQYRTPAGLDELACYRDAGYEPIRRYTTHGTHIMDVATGYPDPIRHHGNIGTRHDEPIVFVQLPRYLKGSQVSGLLRAQVLDAVHYVAGHVAQDKKGVINLSYGANCGSHDGSSILERAFDELLTGYCADEESRLRLVVPSGNALDQSVHAQVHLRTGEAQTLRWQNIPDDPSDSFVELWVPNGQSIRVRATPPGAAPSPWVHPASAVRLERLGDTAALLIGAGNPCQAESGAMLFLAVAPTRSESGRAAAPYGEWRIEIENIGRGSVLVNAWCERDDPVFGNEAGPRQARFTSHVEKTGTLNSIAHGRKTFVVGGYEIHDFAAGAAEGPVAAMSGTGPGRDLPGRDRHPAPANGTAERGPQILTPCLLGVGEEGIAAAAVLSGDEVRLTGTSVSAAYYTRKVIENSFGQPNLRRVVPGEPVAIPGREPHPDDGEPIDRLP